MQITATSGKEAVARPLSPVLSPNFKVVDLHIPCRSIRIGSFKVAPDVPLTITSEYFSMTIPTVKDCKHSQLHLLNLILKAI